MNRTFFLSLALLCQQTLAAEPVFDFTDQTPQTPALINFLNETVHGNRALAKAKADGRIGLLLADISDGRNPQWAAIDPDLELYGASTPKLAILLGILYNHKHSNNVFKKNMLTDFNGAITAMIKKSDNFEAGRLFAMTSFESVHAAIVEHGLYEWNEKTQSGKGGLWAGGTYNTSEVKQWFKDHPDMAEKYSPDFSEHLSPKGDWRFALTVRGGASFLLLMQNGQLVDAESSTIAKNYLKQISTSKFMPGIEEDDPNVIWYGKTGTYQGFTSEVILIEGADYRYILALQLADYRSNDVFEYIGKAANAYIRQNR